MDKRTTVTLIVFGLLASSLLASDFYPLTSTNAIVLHFDSRIPETARGTIREDFDRCLIPSVSEIELYHFDQDPTNRLSLAGLWHPYCFAATSRLGPSLPEDGTLANGTFTIEISYAFATNYQRHIESTAAYSNEIAEAYAFIESLSPTNLAAMSTNELLSLDLWKEVPPGQHRPPAEDLDDDLEYCRTRRVFAPPRVAFHVWECGPTNNPPYLWCDVPVNNTIDQRTIVSCNMMLYFQNRWWFSAWPFLEGEQQW